MNAGVLEESEHETVALCRQALRAFREASAERAKLERDPSERLTADVSELELLITDAREAEANAAQALASVSIVQRGDTASPLDETRANGDPSSRLTAGVTLARSASEDLQKGVAELKRRRAHAEQARQLIIAGVVCALLLTVAGGWWGVQAWTTEQLYQSATNALEAGEWDAARSNLLQLQSREANYKDSNTLLRETYYGPAVQYLASGQPDRSRRELEALAKLDPGYKDATKLWWTTRNLEEGECSKLLQQDPDVTRIPKQIQESCNLTPDRFVKSFIEAWLTATDPSELGRWVDIDASSYIKAQCDGSIALCMDNYFPGVRTRLVAQIRVANNEALKAELVADVWKAVEIKGPVDRDEKLQLAVGTIAADRPSGIAAATARAGPIVPTETQVAGHRTPFAVASVSVTRIEPGRTAVVRLQVVYMDKPVCQTYALDWIPKRGWVLGQIQAPASCN